MDGRSYRVYVRAVNAKGVSSPSPVLSIIAADLPLPATVAPTYLEIHPTSMTVKWAEPDPEYSNRDTPSTRGQALSGFKLYMYPGVALNRAEDMLPVKSEIQSIVATNLVPANEQQVRLCRVCGVATVCERRLREGRGGLVG